MGGRVEGCLHHACRHNRDRCVAILTAHNVPLNLLDDGGRTPMMICCSLGHKESLRLLLLAKADFSLRDHNGWDALAHSIGRTRRHAICMRMLVAAGANVDASDANGITALHRAAAAGELVAASVLIDLLANVNAVDNTGTTALHTACENGHTRLVQLLLVEGAGVSVARSSDGAWPAHLAAMAGHTDILVCIHVCVCVNKQYYIQVLTSCKSNSNAIIVRVCVLCSPLLSAFMGPINMNRSFCLLWMAEYVWTPTLSGGETMWKVGDRIAQEWTKRVKVVETFFSSSIWLHSLPPAHLLTPISIAQPIYSHAFIISPSHCYFFSFSLSLFSLTHLSLQWTFNCHSFSPILPYLFFSLQKLANPYSSARHYDP